jgi:hypothetical protein
MQVGYETSNVAGEHAPERQRSRFDHRDLVTSRPAGGGNFGPNEPSSDHYDALHTCIELFPKRQAILRSPQHMNSVELRAAQGSSRSTSSEHYSSG